MVQRSRRFAPAFAALACGAASLAADPSTAELKAQVEALQKKVEALEARQMSGPQVDAVVRDMLIDSERRSQLMQVEGFTAGYTSSRGFVLQDPQGNFLLHPYFQFQVRNVTNRREDFNDGDADTQNGFEVRRMKFGVDGNAYTPDLTYTFQWQTDRTTGTPGLEDAWAKYRFAEQWSMQAGQFKDPLFRESLVSSMKQLAAERSLQNTILENTDNYVQGLSLIYDNGYRFRAQGAFTDGFGGTNSNFQDPFGNTGDAAFAANGNKRTDFGVAGRAEYMVMGDPARTWKQYSAFSAQGASSDMLIFGVAGEWDQAADADYYWYTADAQWEPSAIKGLSIYGAFVGRYTNIGSPEAPPDSASNWGFLVQAGYMLTSRLEPFARYDYTRVDQDILSNAGAAAFGSRDIQELTAGVNYYFYGQNARLTLDLTYLPEGYFGSPSATGLGILGQAQGENQWITRVQFQLVL